MLSPKRISLLLAATVFASLVVVIIATTYGEGQTTISTDGSKIKVLRRKGQHNVGPTAAEIDFARRQNAAQQNKQEERELEDTTPAHVPIKIKIRKEKEKNFKDLNNENWLRDLEIEVKNTGTKPIYFLHIQVHLPETRGPGGNLDVIPLFYGRSDLISLSAPLKPTDVPIKPGETHTFTIPKNAVGGWELFVRDEHISQPKKVRVVFQLINFGDGTGLSNTAGEPLPRPRKTPGSSAACSPPNINETKVASESQMGTQQVSHGRAPTVAFRSSLPQPTTAPRIAVATDLTMT